MDANRQASATTRHPAAVWVGRLGGVVFGVLMAWLMAEVLLRLFFFSLPPRLQLVLNHVHKTPFTESKLLPDPIWQPDRALLKRYGLFGPPGILFFGKQGPELVDFRVTGYQNASQFLKTLQGVGL